MGAAPQIGARAGRDDFHIDAHLGLVIDEGINTERFAEEALARGENDSSLPQ